MIITISIIIFLGIDTALLSKNSRIFFTNSLMRDNHTYELWNFKIRGAYFPQSIIKC